MIQVAGDIDYRDTGYTSAVCKAYVVSVGVSLSLPVLGNKQEHKESITSAEARWREPVGAFRNPAESAYGYGNAGDLIGSGVMSVINLKIFFPCQLFSLSVNDKSHSLEPLTLAFNFHQRS